MRRVLAAAGLAVGLVVVLAAPAAAHAQLVSTTPGAGSVLTSSPPAAVVRFNEPVQVRPDGLQLHDGRGRRVDDGGVRRVDGGRTIRLPLPELRDGGYVLTWRVVSDDGHPVGGGVTWRLGAGSAVVDQGLLQQLLDAEGGDAQVRVVAAVLRALLFGALVVLVGGALFVAFVWPDGWSRLRRPLRASAAVAAVVTVAGMGLQGADVAGFGLGDAVRFSLAWDTVHTSYGQAALARLVLLAALVVLLERRWRPALVAVGVATLGTLTWAGHARTGRWVAAAIPLDVVHLVAGALWLGGLAVLVAVVLPRLSPDDALPVARRFSRVAAGCVLVIVASGVVQAWRQLGAVAGLRDTGYGRLLVVKVVLVAVVVVLGAMSRSRLASGARALAQSVRAEALLAVVVLAVTSLLVAADPARTIEARAWHEDRLVQGSIIEAVAAPSRTGPVDFHVYLTDATVGLTTPLTVKAELSLPSKGIPAIRVPLSAAGRGHWSAYDVDVPIAGTWQLEVAVGIGQFEQRGTTFHVPID